MANTYTQIYVQIIFAVKGGQSLIRRSYAEDIYRYITGIVQHPSRNHKMLAINGMPDHIHMLIGLQPAKTISSLVRDIKSNSSSVINDHRLVHSEFCWQTGYGAFSYSRSQRSDVVRYIENQQKHHRQKTFREEYEALLRLFEVEYDPQYLFEWFEYDPQDYV
jgi:REP element-mobilizing transposase RayT